MRTTYQTVRLLGFACVGLAGLHMSLLQYGIMAGTHTSDPGVWAGNEALAFVGLLAFVVAQALKNLETRLPSAPQPSKLES